jgi:endonuclease/exonuclease/phosphatase (EEP) superfamily protein YafD
MSEPVSAAPPRPRPSRGRRVVAVACWVYLAAMVALWLVLLRAEEWWPATILMFSPRWVFALPLAVLVPAAALRRSRSALALVPAALIVGGPVTGFNVPWSRLTGPAPSGPPFRVMTLNMHYSHAAPVTIDELAAGADVVAVQEWPGFGRSGLKGPDWHVHATPRLFLASRHPIRRAVVLGHNPMGEDASAAHYELDTPRGVVHVFSLHTASTREGIADTLRDGRNGPAEVRANSARRREQCAFVAGRAAECGGPVIAVGDFNTPPESPILGDVWGGYTDAFAAAGWGWGYTFRGAKTAVRIDHILVGPGWQVSGCRVGPNVGSPHRPVIAELTRDR